MPSWAAAVVAAGMLLAVRGCGQASGRSEMFLGVATDDLAGLAAFEGLAGRRVAVWSYFQAWGAAGGFDADRAQRSMRRGVLPMVTWEPWDPGAGVGQPGFSMRRIAAGAFDDYLHQWARDVARWGQPLLVRFAHEPNLDIYPWGATVNGNEPADYRAAWRHVHDVVAATAPRVVWVWAVNVLGAGSAPLGKLYPGDRYVDWVGVDGYNGGTSVPYGGWLSPQRVFADTFSAVRQLSDKPVVITEVACAEAGGSKPGWIADLVGTARRLRAAGLIWFEYDKETDWRVESSPAAAAAFRAAVAGLPASPRLPAPVPSGVPPAPPPDEWLRSGSPPSGGAPAGSR